MALAGGKTLEATITPEGTVVVVVTTEVVVEGRVEMAITNMAAGTGTAEGEFYGTGLLLASLSI